MTTSPRSLLLSPLVLTGLCLPLLLGLGATSAQATTITLSTHSSDATDPSLLDATLDFSITGPSELTLTVANNTPDYDINNIFFNGSTEVTSLALVSATKNPGGQNFNVTGRWELHLGPPETSADGFGAFDFNLEAQGTGGWAKRKVRPGDTVVFVFAITGTGPYDMDDFAAELSTAPPGDIPAIAAAEFVEGPDYDNAVGAFVPEPDTTALIALGLLGLALSGRRRESSLSS